MFSDCSSKRNDQKHPQYRPSHPGRTRRRRGICWGLNRRHRTPPRGASSSEKRGVSGGGAETSQDGQLGLQPWGGEGDLLVRRNATDVWIRSSKKQFSKWGRVPSTDAHGRSRQI